jgi:hypothetical protein
VQSVAIFAVLYCGIAWAAGADVRPVAPGCKAVEGGESASASAPHASSGLPLQLEMRVPFEPTAFPSDGRTYVMYELYLANFTGTPLTIQRIEILDADRMSATPITAIEQGELRALTQQVGTQTPDEAGKGLLQLESGKSDMVFLCLAFGRAVHVPNKLRHRIVTRESVLEGAMIGTHHTELHLLGPPLEGKDWLADDGPSNGESNHHRRGILVSEGRPLISRRFAIDWEQTRNGATFSGDPLDKRAYFSYGKTVLAVADGRVVTAKDGLPDNVPGHNEGFHPAIPITMETVGGNCITLEVGPGQFAHYMHLQSGSLRVKAGDRVRRGQVLARVGASGDAREPHLHFQVSTSAGPFDGEGVPYLIAQYRIKSAQDTWETRIRELPIGGMVIDFGALTAVQ